MAKVFYIFRHGETAYNLAEIRQGCSVDLPLTQKGIAQARELAEQLMGIGLECVYSRRLKRAWQTAEEVVARLQVPLLLESELREVDYGVTEGLEKNEIKANDPVLYQRWRSFDQKDFDVRFEGGESKREVMTRMLRAFEKMAQSEFEVIGVATHGAAIRYFLLGLGYKIKKIDNGAVFKVSYNDGQWKLIS